MEHSRCRTSRPDPNVVCSGDGDARSACRKSRFTRKRGRHVCARDLLPSKAAIIRADDQETAIHRIAERDAVSRIPKRETIEERFRFMIRELKTPGLASITRFVDPRLLAFTNAQQERCVGINTMHVAKIQVR